MASTEDIKRNHCNDDLLNDKEALVVKDVIDDNDNKEFTNHTEQTIETEIHKLDIIESADNHKDSYLVEDVPELDVSDLNLTDLPSEILIHVASFLESREIIDSLTLVCQLFSDLFGNDRYWKTRISTRWPKPYPILERDDFDWRIACMEREEIARRWASPDEHFHHFMFRDGFFAPVDIVHLMNDGRQLAIGSRDRHFNMLDLTKFDCDNPRESQEHVHAFNDTKTHKGWVWSMASCDNVLATGSWDTYIRLWDTGDGDVQCTSNIRIYSAVLGLHFEQGFIAAAGYDKQLWQLDPRSEEVIMKKKCHAGPILSIAADDKFIITGSEDKFVSVYDRTAGKNFKKIKTESFVMDMSYRNGQLWIGDKEGKLNLLDARNGLFDESTIQTIDVGHTKSLVGVVHTDGGIFTGSTDSQIKVVEPCLNPEIINTMTCHTNAVSRISHQNGVLASAGTDIAVGVWMPKDRKF